MSDLLKDLSKTLSPEAKEQLAPAPQEGQQELPPEESILTHMITTLENMNLAFTACQAELRQIRVRQVALEQNVDYLLSKDPQFMEALKKAQEQTQSGKEEK
ncbi:MAG: hypothetical protein QXL01_00245 [Thermoplasmatales archaeon]